MDMGRVGYKGTRTHTRSFLRVITHIRACTQNAGFYHMHCGYFLRVPIEYVLNCHPKFGLVTRLISALLFRLFKVLCLYERVCFTEIEPYSISSVQHYYKERTHICFTKIMMSILLNLSFIHAIM
jgi:hypothetical protein